MVKNDQCLIEEKLLRSYLRLNVHVVGMEMVEVFNNDYRYGNKTDNKMSYCQMIAKAAEGGLFKVEDNDFSCDTAARMLGIREYFDEEEDVNGWNDGGFYENLELAIRQKESVRPVINKNKGLMMGNLGSFEQDPTVVIVLCNPYQGMRLIQGYTYSYGYKKNFELSGMCGACFESSAQPINNDVLNMSLLCSGSRSNTGWTDDLMMVSFPYHMTEKIIKGLMQTANQSEPDEYKLDILSRLEVQGLEPEITLENGMAYFYKEESI